MYPKVSSNVYWCDLALFEIPHWLTVGNSSREKKSMQLILITMGALYFSLSLSLHWLFGGILGRMENLGEKSGEKEVLMGVWLGGRVEKKCGRAQVFSPGPTKKFSPQNGEKIEGRKQKPQNGWILPFALAHEFRPRQLLFPLFFSSSTCTYTIVLLKKCYFFVLFNEDIIVNLYQLHFPSSHFSSQLNK